MSGSAKKTLARALLILLTIPGLISVYQVAFDVWMTAYPYAKADIWRQPLWMRLITTVVIGVLWIVIFSWLIKDRRRGHVRVPNGHHA